MRFVSWNRALTAVLLATALGVAPTRADAQLANTGQFNAGPQAGCDGLFCDARWSVFYGEINGSGAVGPNQYRQFATGVDPRPGVWAPNTLDAMWIGVRSSATLDNGDASGNPRVRYFFGQTFFSATDVVSFNLGWDNIFKGIYVNAASGPNDVPMVINDGTFFSAASLSASGNGFSGMQFITLSGLNAGQTNTIWLEVEGDGTTDALFLANATQVVPEPATMTLLGSGLLAIGGAYRRRRKQQLTA